VLLVEELLDAARLGGGTARKLFGDLAYRSEPLKDALACRGYSLLARVLRSVSSASSGPGSLDST
jgi:hypothetical protein